MTPRCGGFKSKRGDGRAKRTHAQLTNENRAEERTPRPSHRIPLLAESIDLSGLSTRRRRRRRLVATATTTTMHDRHDLDPTEELFANRLCVPAVPAVSSPLPGHLFSRLDGVRALNLRGVPAVPAETLPIVRAVAGVCPHLTRNSFLSSRDSRDTRSGSDDTTRYEGSSGFRGVPGGKRDSRDSRDGGWSA